MDQDTPVRRSRRAVLGAALGGAAAVAATAVAKPLSVSAADGNPVNLGQANSATGTTSIGVGGDNMGFQVAGNTTEANLAEFSNGSTGTGLFAQSTHGAGALFVTVDGKWGAGGTSSQGTIGLTGGSNSTTEELAPNYVAETGVFGVGKVTDTSLSTGVWGEGDTGVYGYGSFGVWGDGFNGVRGQAVEEAGAVGVVAAAPTTNQYALVASGKVKLSRSGRAYLSSGGKSKKVTMAGCTSSTRVMAQLATNRAGYYIQAVVPTTGSFTLYVNKAVPGTTYFTYVVFDA